METILLLLAMLGISLFSIFVADYYIVERRSKRMVQLIKNEFLHSKQGEQLSRLIEDLLVWRKEHGKEVIRDLDTILRFIHRWAERLREKEKGLKGQASD